MISNRFHHYTNLETFLSKKFSASSDDSTYTYGGTGDVYEGEPDISWKSVVYVGEVSWICTHGKIYDCSGKATSLKTPVFINGTEFSGDKDIVTDRWGKEVSIGIKGAEGVIVDGSQGSVSLPLPNLIESRVLKDSEGRIITETYPTFNDLGQSIHDLSNFTIYVGDDETYPTLEREPAVSWENPEEHAGDYYVTSEGRIFQFIETIEGGSWEWHEITDHYLYGCLEDLKEVKKRVNISGKWETIPQTTIESGEIYVSGQKRTSSYLDVLSCPGFVTFSLSSDTSIYLPYIYGGSWNRTLTDYYMTKSLVRVEDLSRINGKTIVITNVTEAPGIITLFLGTSPDRTSPTQTINPGEVYIIKSVTDIISGKLVHYWNVSGVGKTSNVWT